MLFSRSVMSNSLWPHRLHRLLFFSQLFVRPPQTAVLLFCISFPWGWSWCLSPVKCHEPLSIVHQALCVSDLGREKPNRVLSRECTGHSKHPLHTTQEKTSSDGQHQNQIDYILCSQRWRSSVHSTKTRPGADCGSDHELLITKVRLKLKKVGKNH